MSNKNFCILPFIHLATTTEGHCRLCCKVSRHDVICDESGTPYNVNTHSIDEIWNSAHYKQIRDRVLADEQLPECSVCWREEETFYSEWSKDRSELPSKRRKENQKWLHREKTRLQEPVETVISNPRIRYFDIRLSNLCNLKCRMCWPQFSTQIAREQQHFANTGQATWYKDYAVPEWDTARLWQGITDNTVAVEEITFVGGEPTLHDEMYQLLEQFIEQGLSKNIRLKFTTNLTNLQQRLLDAIPHFKNVVINTSIDGVGAVNSYIRHPSDWNTVTRNLDRLSAMLADNNLSINITPVIQIYNIFDLGNLVRWYVEKWIQFPGRLYFGLDLDLLYDPSYLSARVMNRSGRELWYHTVLQPTLDWLDETVNTIETQDSSVSDYWRHIVEVKKLVVNIAKYLEVLRLDDSGKLTFMAYSSSEIENRDQLVDKLAAYTAQLDQHRTESIYDHMPFFDDVISKHSS